MTYSKQAFDELIKRHGKIFGHSDEEDPVQIQIYFKSEEDNYTENESEHIEIEAVESILILTKHRERECYEEDEKGFSIKDENDQVIPTGEREYWTTTDYIPYENILAVNIINISQKTPTY